MKKDLLIFLDFDGVFHYFWPHPEASDEENSFFYFVPIFEKTILEFSELFNFKIVISSSWRNNKSLDQLRSPFSKFIQRMIIDVTPNHSDNSDGSRLREAEEWLLTNQYNGDWLSIDDHPDIWYNHKNLIRCQDGFTQEIYLLMRERLINLSGV